MIALATAYPLSCHTHKQDLDSAVRAIRLSGRHDNALSINQLTGFKVTINRYEHTLRSESFGVAGFTCELAASDCELTTELPDVR